MVTPVAFLEKKRADIEKSIGQGDYAKAQKNVQEAIKYIQKNIVCHSREYYVLNSNFAGLLADIAAFSNNGNLSKEAIALFEDHKDGMINSIGEAKYFYNLGNAYTGLLLESNSFKIDFDSIDNFITAKNCFWRSIRAAEQNESEVFVLQLKVNLANLLKRQFRLSEAFKYYDEVMDNPLAPTECYINYAESLDYLRRVFGTKTLRMFLKCLDAYKTALGRSDLYGEYKKYIGSQCDYYQRHVDFLLQEMPSSSSDTSHDEYLQLDEFQRFCLDNHLNLSVHGLYCKCNGSAKDFLSVMPPYALTKDNRLPEFERRLDIIKQLFVGVKKDLYEYLHPTNPDIADSVSVFSTSNELFLDDVIRKLYDAYKGCVSILDKIVNGIAFLYPEIKRINEKGKEVDLNIVNLFSLRLPGRKEIFSKIANPGVLAIYSISSDLNTFMKGELTELREWRHPMEHNYFYIVKSKEIAKEINDNDNKSLAVSKDEFENKLNLLVQITRSAIFSFAFAIRWYFNKPDVDKFYTINDEY